MADLQGMRAVVTGASSGIGTATARALAQAGAKVVVVGRRRERLEELAKEIDGQLAVADLRHAEQVEQLRSQVLAEGGVDILVNNAGVGKYGPLDVYSVEDYEWMMDTNMKSSFLCTRAFLPGMLEQGRGHVVFVASVAGLKGLPNESLYCASKFAQVGFAQALDYETRERGVKVSVIAPGGVHTEFAWGTGRSPDDPKLRQMLDPEDVAAAVVFAVTQPEKSRVFMVGMRPMSEPL